MPSLISRLLPALALACVPALAAPPTPSIAELTQFLHNGTANTPAPGSMGLDDMRRTTLKISAISHAKDGGYSKGTGSGFLVNKEQCLMYTAAHVVDNAAFIWVNKADDTVNRIPARVYGVPDSKNDIAVLQLEHCGNIPVAPIGNSNDLATGDPVYAIGSPFGQNDIITFGRVSRIEASGSYSAYGYIQANISVNPGNSGGPLFNSRGEVVGINVFIITRVGQSAGIAYSLPIEAAHRSAHQIYAQGRPSWPTLNFLPVEISVNDGYNLGLSNREVALSISGVMVGVVRPNSPTHAAGLMTGDVVVAINGRDVRNLEHFRKLEDDLEAGTTATLRVLRMEHFIELEVQVGDAWETAQHPSFPPAEPYDDLLGLSTDVKASIPFPIVLGVKNLSPAHQAAIPPMSTTNVPSGNGFSVSMPQFFVIRSVDARGMVPMSLFRVPDMSSFNDYVRRAHAQGRDVTLTLQLFRPNPATQRFEPSGTFRVHTLTPKSFNSYTSAS